MAEWLIDAGIGAVRAALVADDRIVLAQVECDHDGPRMGAVVAARVTALDRARGRAVLVLDTDRQLSAHLARPPASLTEGARVRVQLSRMELAEAGRVKPAQARLVGADTPLTDGPDLMTRANASPFPVRVVPAARPGSPDPLDDAGWDALAEAASGCLWPFSGGQLILSPTPAMLVIDVDGALPGEALALAAATAAGEAVAALDIGGPVGIDFPTIQGRAPRSAVGATLDAALDHPALVAVGAGGHERTALNGFGFLQLVRPRLRPSLVERHQFDRDRTDALALLRRAQRAVGTGVLTLSARAGVLAVLRAARGRICALLQPGMPRPRPLGVAGRGLSPAHRGQRGRGSGRARYRGPRRRRRRRLTRHPFVTKALDRATSGAYSRASLPG